MENEVKPIIESLKKKHHSANHVCYAWQLGIENYSFRVNDDGEPNNSAGMPIYGQIQSFDVTNVLIAVVRIFGGTKLGVGGLIGAYKTGAQMVLEASNIVEKIVCEEFELSFEYQEIDKVMRIIKQEKLQIISQQMALNCRLIISVRHTHVAQIKLLFAEYHEIQLAPLKKD